MDTLKCVIVGNSGVGKTTFVKRLRTGEFDKKHIATIGVECNSVKFYVPKLAKEVCFSVWDTAGDDKFRGLSDGYYIGANSAIVMFSYDSKKSFDNVKYWINEVKRVKANIPFVICGTKFDLPDSTKRVSNEDVFKLIKELNIPYYDISAKTNYNIENPFLSILRNFMGNDTLCFGENPNASALLLIMKRKNGVRRRITRICWMNFMNSNPK